MFQRWFRFQVITCGQLLLIFFITLWYVFDINPTIIYRLVLRYQRTRRHIFYLTRIESTVNINISEEQIFWNHYE